jgi:hypothetical protein
VVQQLWGLEPGASYRLTVRARSDGSGPGRAEVHFLDPARPRGTTGYAWTSRPEWTTLELLFTSTGTYANVQLALSPETPAGVVNFDDVSLVRTSPAR